MDISKVLKILSSAFKTPSKPLTPLPPLIVLSGGNIRPGLSPRKIAARIIARQSEAGAPVGSLPDGSQNVAEAMEVIRIEEIINALQTESKIEVVLPPGIPITAAGGNAGGPVISQGATISTAQGTGVIR